MPYQGNTAPKTEFTHRTPYKVFIPHEVYLKLRAYITQVKNEVGGWGSVEVLHDQKTIVVTDVFLIEQEVTAGTTVLDQKGLAKFFAERKKLDPGDDFSTYKLWWHSHANFSTIWSQTDDDTIESLNPFDDETNPLTIESSSEWMLSIVDNYQGDLVARLDVYSPFRITYNKLFWWRESIPQDILTATQKEIDEKVREYVAPPKKKNGGFTGKGRPPGGKNGATNGVSKYVRRNGVLVPDDLEDEDFFMDSATLVDDVISKQKVLPGVH